MLFAAAHPERARALVLAAIFAKRIWSPDYPWAPTPQERERERSLLEREGPVTWTWRRWHQARSATQR